jgi:hypothetical protein
MDHALSLLAFAVAASGAAASDPPALTIYRADADALFASEESPVDDGYAIVHESRALKLGGGRESLVVDGLPATLDAEAVSVDLGAAARVLGQRVLSGGGNLLSAHRGERVTVGAGGERIDGTLVGIDHGALIIRDASSNQTVYVRDYATLRFVEGGGAPGSTLQIAVDGKPGAVDAELTYPTSGLGWRAAYSMLLLDGDACRARLEALASVANRSGRDYANATIKLVAGAPNVSRGGGPHPVAYKAMAAAPAPEGLPEQSSLGDYRSYAIDGALDLPDASVTQVPLYASVEIACERRWIAESGGAWFPPKPILAEGANAMQGAPVVSEIRFTPSENLPAGNLRVLTRDRDGRIEFLGDARIADTQKGRVVSIELGNAFDLRATRERTAFSVDKAAREMREAFRIALANTGEKTRTITVREHPNRWRAWTLDSSSRKPVKQTPDLVEFEIAVPANGKAMLDYAVRYAWTAKDE